MRQYSAGLILLWDHTFCLMNMFNTMWWTIVNKTTIVNYNKSIAQPTGTNNECILLTFCLDMVLGFGRSDIQYDHANISYILFWNVARRIDRCTGFFFVLFFNVTIKQPSLTRVAPLFVLTHWGRVTHICVGNLTIIGPDNGLSPGRRQAINWTNAGMLLIGPWGTNFSEILI